jgi:MFS family permease
MNLAQVGWLAAIYPATWGLAQLVTGALSDRTGRKPLIVWGMWVQAAGIGVVTVAQAFEGFVAPCCWASEALNPPNPLKA